MPGQIKLLQMNTPLTLTMATALVLVQTALADETNSVIAPGAKLEKLAGDFKFTEGPTADRDGNVFFTDQPNNRILKWSVAEGKLSTFMQPAGRANGMFFDSQGNLIACADEKTELWSITPDGKHTVLAKEFEGKALNGPNDVWVRADGSLYFTDPFYKRPWWDYNQPPQGTEQVYFLSADCKTLKRVTVDLVQPNGIIGTPDGKKLFVADIKASKTYAFDIQPDGALANKRLHCELGSDGMTLDEKGNVTVKSGQHTGVRGLYLVGDAAGDVQFAIMSAAEGAKAAVAINKDLQKEELQLR